MSFKIDMNSIPRFNQDVFIRYLDFDEKKVYLYQSNSKKLLSGNKDVSRIILNINSSYTLKDICTKITSFYGNLTLGNQKKIETKVISFIYNLHELRFLSLTAKR